MNPIPKKILAYARCSSENQAEGTTLQDQQAVISQWVERSFSRKVDRFYVEAESAVHENNERREQIQALLLDVRAGDLVLCDKIDRWSRDPEFTYVSINGLLKLGARFFAVGDNCDPSTQEGDTMLNFRVIFAREEHKRIKQRLVGTRKLLRNAGYYAEGLPPFGYVRGEGREKNALLINEARAEIVRRVFVLARDHSLSKVSDLLSLRKDHIADMLHNRVYLGECKDSNGEWRRGKHIAIVDRDTYNRAQEALASRRYGGPGAFSGQCLTSGWILRDLAYCSKCGAKMSANYGGKDYLRLRNFYYSCCKRCTPKYVPVRSTEADAAVLILARLEELKDELSKEPAKSERAIVDYTETKAQLLSRKSRIGDRYELGEFTKEQYRQRLDELDRKLIEIEAKEEQQAKANPLEDEQIRRSVFLQAGRLERLWNSAKPEEQRKIANQLAHKAHLSFGQPVTFSWRSAAELAETV